MNKLRPEKGRRPEIIAAVTEHLLRKGMHNSALRALAKSVGISDRMIMYYFNTKEELIAEALLQIADGLVTTLEGIIPGGQVSGQQIIKAMRESIGHADFQPGLRLWFEIVGLAMREDGPYRATAEQILSGWEEWIRGKLGSKREHLAPEILAQIEGELMIRLIRQPQQNIP